MLEGLRFQKLDEEVMGINKRMDTLTEQLAQTQVRDDGLIFTFQTILYVTALMMPPLT